MKPTFIPFNSLRAGDLVICNGPLDGTDFVMNNHVGQVVRKVKPKIYRVRLLQVGAAQNLIWTIYEDQMIKRLDIH